MKSLKCVVGCFVLISAIAASASAHSDGDDNAGNYASGSWTNGSNAGTGLGPCQLSGVTGGWSGWFLGDSTGNGAGGHAGINSSGNSEAWGIYANTSNLGEAIRPFNIPLTLTGQYVTIDFENGYIQGGGTVGLGLQDSEGNNLLELYFAGGQNCYSLANGPTTANGSTATTNSNTGIGFTDTGLHLAFTLQSGNKVNVSVTGLNGNNASFTDNGVALDTSGTGGDETIAKIRFFNYNAGSGNQYNDFYNNLTVVPEPSSIVLVGLGLLGAFAIRRRK